MEAIKKLQLGFSFVLLFFSMSFLVSCNPGGESSITNNLDFAYITTKGTQTVAATRDGYMQIPETGHFIAGECYFVAYVYSVGHMQGELIIPDFFRAITENGEPITQTKLKHYLGDPATRPEVENEYPISGVNGIYFSANSYFGNRWLIPVSFKGVTSKANLELHAFYSPNKQVLPENIVMPEKYVIIDLCAELKSPIEQPNKEAHDRRNFVVDLTSLKASLSQLSSSTEPQRVRVLFRYYEVVKQESDGTPMLREKIIGADNTEYFMLINENSK